MRLSALRALGAVAWLAAIAACGPRGDGGTVMTDDVTTMDMDAVASDAEVPPDPNTLPDGAPNPCVAATTCGECTNNSPCGFCNGLCKAGLENGSFDGTCTGEAWIYQGYRCPGIGAQCPSHTDCSSCAMDPNSCGWCANTGQCVGGGSQGPSQSIAGCSPTAGTWIYNLDRQVCP